MFNLAFRVRQSFGDLAGGLGARCSSDDSRGQTTELDPQVGESLRPRGRRFYRRFGGGAANGLAAPPPGRRPSENSTDARQTFSRRLREYTSSFFPLPPFPPLAAPPHFAKSRVEKKSSEGYTTKTWNTIRVEKTEYFELNGTILSTFGWRTRS